MSVTIAVAPPLEYANTSFRDGITDTFAVGSHLDAQGHYPLYVAYENSGPSITTLFVRGSLDGGRHWSAPLQVNDSNGQADALQPNLAVAPNGTVAVAFYDRRLACPARNTPEALVAGLSFDPREPYRRLNYCIDTAVQFYRPKLTPVYKTKAVVSR